MRRTPFTCYPKKTTTQRREVIVTPTPGSSPEDVRRRAAPARLARGVLAQTALAIGAEIAVPSRQGQFRFDPEHAAARPHHVRDDALGWRLKPGQTDRLHTNSLGFRGPEFSWDPSPDRWRLVFLGDSNPLGFGLVDETEPYPARVQQILTDFVPPGARRGYESINLGVDGYSSLQVRRLAADVLPKLGADIVAVQVGFNDFCFASRPDLEALAGGGSACRASSTPWPTGGSAGKS
jgi:hypothetical protein